MMPTHVPTLENSYSNDLGELFSALAKAQGKIEHALKDKKNPFFKSSYADLTSVWEACREPLSNNGLAIIQTVEGTKDGMVLLTWLGHSSGQWIKSRLPLFNLKQDPQAVGSAITYARRYALSAMVGICADEDDDGEKAMGRKESSKQKIEHSPKEIEKQMESFIQQFSDEDPLLVKAYFEKYATHYKKSIVESLNDYENPETFLKDFNIFKNRTKKQAA